MVMAILEVTSLRQGSWDTGRYQPSTPGRVKLPTGLMQCSTVLTIRAVTPEGTSRLPPETTSLRRVSCCVQRSSSFMLLIIGQGHSCCWDTGKDKQSTPEVTEQHYTARMTGSAKHSTKKTSVGSAKYTALLINYNQRQFNIRAPTHGRVPNATSSQTHQGIKI